VNKNMVRFLKNNNNSKHTIWRRTPRWSPIGIDIGVETIKMAQLTTNGSGTTLLAVGIKNQPEYIKNGSGSWQRWAIDVIRELASNGKFRSKEINAAIPPGNVFIEHLKLSNKENDSNQKKINDTILSKIKQKLPIDLEHTMIKYIPAEEGIIVVFAAERRIIDRHLAIYERANLAIKTICVWPIALINTYTEFFGRRKEDVDAVVMLMEVDTDCTNVVICRHKKLLFAHSIQIGTNILNNDEMLKRLVLELTGCRRQFSSLYKRAQIQRLIFLSDQSSGRDKCATIAKQLEMPAQIGDCLAAVKVENPSNSGIDRRDSQANWSTAFGLSLA